MRPADPTFKQLVGSYWSKSPELEKQAGPLDSFEDLELLADGSYYLLQFSDLLPVPVVDTGHWKHQRRKVFLSSDHRARWDNRHQTERYYSVFTLEADPNAKLRLLARSIGYFKDDRVVPDSLAKDHLALLGTTLVQQDPKRKSTQKRKADLEAMLYRTNARSKTPATQG